MGWIVSLLQNPKPSDPICGNNQVKRRSHGWFLIQNDWCFIKRGNLDTGIHRDKAMWRDTERRQPSTRQGERPGTDPSLMTLIRNQSCWWHIDFGLAASKTGRRTFLLLTTPICGSPRKLIQSLTSSFSSHFPILLKTHKYHLTPWTTVKPPLYCAGADAVAHSHPLCIHGIVAPWLTLTHHDAYKELVRRLKWGKVWEHALPGTRNEAGKHSVSTLLKWSDNIPHYSGTK